MIAPQEIQYYELIAQNRNGELILKIIGSEKYIIKTAEEVMKDIQLYNGLSTNDAGIIQFIAQTS